MIYNTILKAKKIGIIGLARTGLSCYKSLLSPERLVICFDDNEKIRNEFIKSYNRNHLIDIKNPIWETLDYIIVSPGIPLIYPRVHRIALIAKKANIPLISDVDLFYSKISTLDFIGVTGTNGKSTTTTLITHILNECYFNFSSGGNIGNACFDLPTTKNGYVLELSSFQLELISYLKLKIAILLNITPDHLDRYQNFNEYQIVKYKIFKLLSKDGIGIIDSEDPSSYLLSQYSNKFLSFSTTNNKASVYINNNLLFDNINNCIHEIPLPIDLQGEHNAKNIAAAYLASLFIGCKPDKIISALNSFKGLPHRFQYVGKKGNIHFYNDSKATNFSAASKSISSLSNVYWLVGGINKANDVECINSFKNKINKAYIYGTNTQYLAKYFSKILDIAVFDTLKEAFDSALFDALNLTHAQYPHLDIENSNILENQPIANILLAPGCSSFDQFENYEHRGKYFTDLCEKLFIKK